MDWQGWFTLAVVLLTLAAMVRGLGAPDVVMMAGLFTLAAFGVLSAAETFMGFANPALAAIGALFIVSAALRETGALEATIGRVFGSAHDERVGLARICPPVATLSAFLNNAPIVAMMTPAVLDWARRVDIAPSRLLIPLSYAAILGSTTTLIGTSVNLTVAGLMSEAWMERMGFFELFPLGAPIAIVGVLYLIFIGWRWRRGSQFTYLELSDHLRRQHRLAFGFDDLGECAIVRCKYFDNDFVGFNVD